MSEAGHPRQGSLSIALRLQTLSARPCCAEVFPFLATGLAATSHATPFEIDLFNVALECRSVGGIQLHNRDVCLEHRYRMVNRIDIVTSGHRVGLVFAPNTRQILRRRTLSKRRPETVRQSEAFLACHDDAVVRNSKKLQGRSHSALTLRFRSSVHFLSLLRGECCRK